MPTQQIVNGTRPVIESTPPPTTETVDDTPPVVESTSPVRAEDDVRDLAVKQIERKRHFQMRAFGGTVVSVMLVIIWAIAEYHNAHGWPTNGFSQSSGIYHTWNSWIVYPIVVITFGIAIDGWNTFRRKPISESEIRREMDRITRAD